MTRAVSFTQAELERAIRAAKKAGVRAVVITKDGKIAIDPTPRKDGEGLIEPERPQFEIQPVVVL